MFGQSRLVHVFYLFYHHEYQLAEITLVKFVKIKMDPSCRKEEKEIIIVPVPQVSHKQTKQDFYF